MAEVESRAEEEAGATSIAPSVDSGGPSIAEARADAAKGSRSARSVVVRVVQVVAVALIVGLFSCLYCWYFWDPPENLKSVRVGVINEDAGAEVGGVWRNIGDEVWDELSENDSVSWTRMYPEEMDGGIENTDYLIVVEIPEDFTEKVARGQSGTPEVADLLVTRNVRHNYMFSQFTRQVTTSLQEGVDKAIQKTYVEGAYDGLASARDGMSAAADAAGKVADGAGDVTDAVAQLSDGSASLVDATSSLPDSASKLASATSSVADGVTSAADASAKLASASRSIGDGLTTLQQNLSALADAGMASDADLQMLAALGDASDPTSLLGASAALTQGLDQLHGGDDGGLVAASSALAQIKSGMGTLADGMPSLAAGISSLDEGLSKLEGGTASLEDGSDKLSSSLADGADAISSSLGVSGEEMGEYVSEPTNLVEEDYGGLDHYGEGFSPFFMTTALWLGSLIIFFMVDPFWARSKHAGRFRTVLGRMPLYLLMCAMNAVAVVLCAVAVGVTSSYDVNGVAFLLFAFAVSVSFMLMMQFLNLTFGLLGKAAVLILLVVQLPLAGGTLPLELGRGTLDALQPFLPFTYSLDGFREVISLGNVGVITQDALVLLGMGAVCLVLSLCMWDLACKIRDISDAQTLAHCLDA